MSKATEARSDQINYVDIGHEGLKAIKVTSAHLVEDGKGGFKTVINYEGGEGRPYKPSKGMDRLIQSKHGWGSNSDDWIGKSILLTGNKDVMWAGGAHGGIQIKALSDIDAKGFSEFIALNRSKRRLYKVEFFDAIEYMKSLFGKPTPEDQQWVDAIKADEKVLEQLEEGQYKEKIKSFLN